MVEEIKNMCCIRVCSTANNWLDCIFVVSPRDRDAAIAVLKNAYGSFWDQEDEPYGDYFCYALDEAEIPYEIYYTSDDE